MPAPFPASAEGPNESAQPSSLCSEGSGGLAPAPSQLPSLQPLQPLLQSIAQSVALLLAQASVLSIALSPVQSSAQFPIQSPVVQSPIQSLAQPSVQSTTQPPGQLHIEGGSPYLLALHLLLLEAPVSQSSTLRLPRCFLFLLAVQENRFSYPSLLEGPRGPFSHLLSAAGGPRAHPASRLC